ncbi:phenylacetic acid degradation protein PaaY [Endozoicomonas sp. OPT23]|uniref:phenylacetic acid degradation protein PaaY n=1 Tax=Endozoicomonas sp. OPT23 TaxID=2072845 RepID=UPI00129BC38A|nr:phenylacetic acid degradation protein PaaY [Endozoicomonas sp. OPT23]MRI33623.1 phenylacetic acid degradation protein PaaY [Endozoicomonas sp. OPT23]
MPVYAIEDLIPVVDPSAYIHPTAVLIGDVIIGAHCYVGPNAVLRGDFGRIVMEAGSNIQDTCVAHSFPNKDCIIEQDGHIGHGAVLHGCRVGRNALVGMNAVVMDDAVIGAESLVAASAFVKSGFSCPPRSLLAGSPATVKRQLSDKEVAWKSSGTEEYQHLTRRSHESLREVSALIEVQQNRPRFIDSSHKPKQS